MQPIGSGLVAGKKLENRVRLQFYRASYEIPGAISEGESNESSIVASSKRGILPTSKEIIGDTVLLTLSSPPLRNSYSVESSARITS